MASVFDFDLDCKQSLFCSKIWGSNGKIASAMGQSPRSAPPVPSLPLIEKFELAGVTVLNSKVGYLTLTVPLPTQERYNIVQANRWGHPEQNAGGGGNY